VSDEYEAGMDPVMLAFPPIWSCCNAAALVELSFGSDPVKALLLISTCISPWGHGGIAREPEREFPPNLRISRLVRTPDQSPRPDAGPWSPWPVQSRDFILKNISQIEMGGKGEPVKGG